MIYHQLDFVFVYAVGIFSCEQQDTLLSGGLSKRCKQNIKFSRFLFFLIQTNIHPYKNTQSWSPKSYSFPLEMTGFIFCLLLFYFEEKQYKQA